jgi:hypothetical protein
MSDGISKAQRRFFFSIILAVAVIEEIASHNKILLRFTWGTNCISIDNMMVLLF